MKINPKTTISIFPPVKYIDDQKKQGAQVLPRVNPYTGYNYPNSTVWAALYNIKKRDTIVIYDDPEENSFIKNVVHKAFKLGLNVYYRSRDNCKANLSPEYELLTKEKFITTKDSNTFSTYDYTYTQPQYNIPEERKLKMVKYIRYYDLDYPQNEPEWQLALEQLTYYIKNKIDYSFDSNLYYICEECGELIRRGTNEEHVCYCDIAPKRTKLDYIINGGK